MYENNPLRGVGVKAVADAGALDADVLNSYTNSLGITRLLPVQIPPSMQRLLIEEAEVLGPHCGPISRVMLPTKDRMLLRLPGEVPDFVDDSNNAVSPSGRIIRKYGDRILLLTTERCAGHCMYCFRQDMLSAEPEDDDFDQMLAECERMLDEDRKISEVILSGGDPLMLPYRRLEAALGIGGIRNTRPSLRLHTRNFTFAPNSVSDDKLRLIAERDARLVIHVVHPYEISSEFVERAAAARALGIRLYAQFPLLRGVNDSSAVLRMLLAKLDELGVRPLSVFLPDPITYSATYRIPIAEINRIKTELDEGSASWINAVRFVMDTPAGKVRLERLKCRHPEDGVRWVIAKRGDLSYRFADVPLEQYSRPDDRVLLWRER